MHRQAVEPSTGVRVRGSSEQAHTVDALATTGDERRGSLRKAPGSWQISVDPEISEWGNPPARVSRPQSIRPGSEPGELKHLSNQRKRNQSDSLSSGERTGKSLNFYCVSMYALQ